MPTPVTLVLASGAMMHALAVPPGAPVVPMIGPGRVSQLLAQAGGVAAINGGYFNHQDGVGASFIMRDGVLVDDPRTNELLIHNPVLVPLLPRILARTEWRTTSEGWAIAPHGAPGRVRHALQAGPRLLPAMDLVAEGFRSQADGRLLRDPLLADRALPRSALGLEASGRMWWVAVLAPGASLAQVAVGLRRLGCTQGMALDGGSSTSLAWRAGRALQHVAPGGGEAKVRSALVWLSP